jgi:hypothetical protein
MWPFKKKNPAYTVEHPTKGLVLSDVVEVKAEEIPPVIDKAKYKDCELEYFPKEDYWYAKYKGKFIFNGSTSYSLHDGVSCYCLRSRNQDECKAKLDHYLETKGIGTIIVKL